MPASGTNGLIYHTPLILLLSCHCFCRYLYCDDILLEADTVLPTLYAAKKYMVPHFERACVEYLEANVDASNACLLLSQSQLYEEPELEHLCLDVIDSQAQEVLQSDSFVDIDYQTLQQILSRDTLFTDETVVFAAARRWAEAECTRQGRDTSPQQCRGVLGDALYLVRLPTMTPGDFTNGPGQSGLLSQQEVIDILFHFTADNKPELRFPNTCRWEAIKRSTHRVCRRFKLLSESLCLTGRRWEASVGIQFTVDKTISVIGFGLYRYVGHSGYAIDIALKLSGTVLRQKKRNIQTDARPDHTAHHPSNQIVRVLFDHPCRLEANTYYTVSLSVSRIDLNSFYGISGMCQVKCGDINFTFRDIPGPRSFTNVDQGQIPEILFHCWPDTLTKSTYIHYSFVLTLCK